MSLVETLPSESLQPNRLLRDAVVDENVIALLKSVSDYPEQDRLRWNSAEPLKGKVFCGASFRVCDGASSCQDNEALESTFEVLSGKSGDDKFVPVHSIQVNNHQVTYRAMLKLFTSLNRLGSYSQLRNLSLNNAGLTSDTFKAMLICGPLCKLVRLDLSDNMNLNFSENPGRIKILLNRMEKLKILYLNKTGLIHREIKELLEILSLSKAGKSLKALKLGPPIDDLPENTNTAEGIIQSAQKACPKLQILSIYGLEHSATNLEDPWIWTNLPNNGLQGTCLSQEDVARLDEIPGHIAPKSALLHATRAHNADASNDDFAIPGNEMGIQADGNDGFSHPVSRNISHGHGSKVYHMQAAPKRRRVQGSVHRNNANYVGRQAAHGFNSMHHRDLSRGHKETRQQQGQGTRRPSSKVDDFEDHLHGIVNLEGENSDDDERGQKIHDQQLDFIHKADRSGRGERQPSRPRKRSTHHSQIHVREHDMYQQEPIAISSGTESEGTSPEREMYGGSQADLSDHVDEMGVSPKGEHGLGLSQEEEEDKGIVQDEETELEFGLDAEKERVRSKRRKPMTEVEELRAFAFEDEETAREHRASGHFGLPTSRVRPSRMRTGSSALDKLQENRFASLARTHERSNGTQAQDMEQSQSQSLVSSPDKTSSLEGKHVSPVQSRNPSQEELQHGNKVSNVSQEPESEHKFSSQEDVLGVLPEDGPMQSLDSRPMSHEHEANEDNGSESDDEKSFTARKRRNWVFMDSEEQEDLVLPTAEGLDHVLDKTSKPIPEERSHQDDPLSENLAHAQNHSPQNERSQTVREALTNPKTANLEVNDSEKAEEQLNSKKRPSSAAGKEMKRLTEAQRLMTLWAGDKFSEEHPGNRKAMGLEIMPEGAKRQRRMPQRFEHQTSNQGKARTPETSPDAPQKSTQSSSDEEEEIIVVNPRHFAKRRFGLTKTPSQNSGKTGEKEAQNATEGSSKSKSVSHSLLDTGNLKQLSVPERSSKEKAIMSQTSSDADYAKKSNSLQPNSEGANSLEPVNEGINTDDEARDHEVFHREKDSNIIEIHDTETLNQDDKGNGTSTIFESLTGDVLQSDSPQKNSTQVTDNFEGNNDIEGMIKSKVSLAGIQEADQRFREIISQNDKQESLPSNNYDGGQNASTDQTILDNIIPDSDDD